MAEPSRLAAQRRLRISNDSYRRFAADGLTEVQADRYADRAGLMAYEVWPEMVDHLVADAQRTCASDGCDELFVPTRPWSKYCSRRCYRREVQRRQRRRPEVQARKRAHEARYRAETREYRLARQRRYYAENRDRLLAAQKERDRIRRAKDPMGQGSGATGERDGSPQQPSEAA